MRVEKLVVAEGMGGYYFDDLMAIKAGAKKEGNFILGDPITPGHRRVRNPGRTISIMLVLDSGDVALGSCVAIQYSGVVGRDPILLPEVYIPFIEEKVKPLVEGIEITSFKELCEWFDDLKVDGERLHTGIRYGMSQAFLDAVSIKEKLTPSEIVAKEYNTVISKEMIPILAQSSDDRYSNADKMIIKSVPAIPQGLFNSVEKVGEKGEKLEEYLVWLMNRIKEYGEVGYAPIIHLDVYGMPGKIFDNDPIVIAEYFVGLEKLVHPLQLNIECPADTGDRDGTMEVMIEIMRELKKRNSEVAIVADDWCNNLQDVKFFVDHKAADMVQIKAPDLGGLHNSIEAVIYCKQNGIKAFLGGTCNGTDISSRATVQCAMATQSDMVYNKPVMGVDEGYMIVYNEMKRIIALLEANGYYEEVYK